MGSKIISSFMWMLASFSLVLAIHTKHPLTAKIRFLERELQLTIFTILVVYIAFSVLKKRIHRRQLLTLSLLAVFVVSNLFTFFYHEIKFYLNKQVVLNTPQKQLQRLGKHFIIGYTDYQDIKKLVQKGAIGGVYITTRNVKEKSYAVIQKEIAQLQMIRSHNNLPPLLITTDQEGGVTSRLSPPLKQLPPLSELVEDQSSEKEMLRNIRVHAGFQAKDLYDLGINLNLSPVVDLKMEKQKKSLDFHTQIYRRAISSNEDIVTRVGLEYCKSFETMGVIPTLKHFPGLGRVVEDTHLSTGDLNTDLSLLKKKDWKPFKYISKRTGAFIMIGHVKLKGLDPDYPASFSKKIIQNVIRKSWNHSGILITDDLNMTPAAGSSIGIGGAALKALNAGVDLLLISYDGEQYYQAMAAVIKAENDKTLDTHLIRQSAKRLDKALLNISNKRMVASNPEKIHQVFL